MDDTKAVAIVQRQPRPSPLRVLERGTLKIVLFEVKVLSGPSGAGMTRAEEAAAKVGNQLLSRTKVRESKQKQTA